MSGWNKWKKKLLRAGVLTVLAVLTAGRTAGAAMAETGETPERTKVGNIWLAFDSDLGIGRDHHSAEVIPEEASADRYYVDSVEILNDGDEAFSNANPPELEVTLVVVDEELWYFETASSDKIHLRVADSSASRFEKVQFVSGKRQDDNTTLILRVRLLYEKNADTRKAAKAAGFGWDAAQKGLAVWAEEPSARYYQVQLIRDGIETGVVRTVYQNHYDFSDQVTEPGAYQFRIRTVNQGNHNKSEWSVSNVLTVRSDGTFAVAGEYAGAGWQRAADGIRWWWKQEDGTWPSSQWLQIDGKWYYFDSQGYMVTGWHCLDGIWYYFDGESGEAKSATGTPSVPECV